MKPQQFVKLVLFLHQLSLKWLDVGHKLSLSFPQWVHYLNVGAFLAIFFRVHPQRRNATKVDQAHI